MYLRGLPLARVFLFLALEAVADIPVHCQMNNYVGKWTMHRTAPTASGSASPDVPNFAGGGIADKYCGFGHPNRNAENLENMHANIAAHIRSSAVDSHAFELTENVLVQPDQSSLLQANFVGASADTFRAPAGKTNSWSTVYDEGWRVEAHNDKGMTSFFALSAYECIPSENNHCGKSGDNENNLGQTAGYRSQCGKTLGGWYHAPEGLGCFYAEKDADADHAHAYVLSSFVEHPKRALIEVHSIYHEKDFNFMLPSYQQVLQIHNGQGQKNGTRVYRGGVEKNYVGSSKSRWNVVDECQANNAAFANMINTYEQNDPIFDWRTQYNGAWNTPVDDQGACGSCYAVAAKYSLQSRANIKLLQEMEKRSPQMLEAPPKPGVFSAHSVLACSYYNQGCQGGFPYAVAQHAHDFGLPMESCMPYASAGSGDVQQCNAQCFQDESKLLYAGSFKYAEGFYGSCGEARMMADLRANGPVAVAIEVDRKIRSAQPGRTAGDSFLQVAQGATPSEHSKQEGSPGASILEARWGIKVTDPCKPASLASDADVDAGMRDWMGSAYVKVAPKQFAIYLNEMVKDGDDPLYLQTKKQLATLNKVPPECVHVELVAGSLNSWEYTDHAVNVVGWGQQRLEDSRDSKYWIIRNSWGDSYGDAGYAYVARGVNYAGIESQAVLIAPDTGRGWLKAQLDALPAERPLLERGRSGVLATGGVTFAS